MSVNLKTSAKKLLLKQTIKTSEKNLLTNCRDIKGHILILCYAKLAYKYLSWNIKLQGKAISPISWFQVVCAMYKNIQE